MIPSIVGVAASWKDICQGSGESHKVLLKINSYIKGLEYAIKKS
jgi:hypothetical protein